MYVSQFFQACYWFVHWDVPALIRAGSDRQNQNDHTRDW